MAGGGVGGLGAGGRLLQLDLEAAGAARKAAAPAAAAAAAAAPERDLPHLQVRARLLGVLLPERRRVLHGRHLGQPHLQLRVPQRVRGPALRVQGPGRLVRADESTADDGDGFHRWRRHSGRVPRDPGVLRRLGEAPPARQDSAAGRAGPCAAGGRGGAPRPRAAVRAASAVLVARQTLAGVHIVRLCVKLCERTGDIKNLCDN